MRSSVLSSQGHILLIGFFGDFFGNDLLYRSLMDPRARDVSWAKHRLLGASWMDSSLCLCALVFPWLVLVIGRNGSGGSSPYKESLTSRTRCVWGNTVAWTLMTPLNENQKRPFHSLSCDTKQVHSTLQSYLGGTSVPAFLHRLVC